MPAPQVFKVLTEFKFEVGAAVTNASGLQGAVEKVSVAAQDLQFQLARVGIGFAAQLGLAGGGAIGILANIIRQFDTIEKQQIKLGGIFFANRGFITGLDTANDSLRAADKLLLKIARDAEKFGLDERALAQFTTLGIGITAKEGISPEQNVKFARNILKAAPQLGINAFDAQGQITRGLLGGASLGDPAFRAVVQETKVFQDFAKKIGGITKVTKEFNKLPTAERFNLLNAAFGQFTENADLLSKAANTISSLFLRIRQSLFGLNGVFGPFGKVVVPLVKDALNRLITFIKGPFRTILQNLSEVFKSLIPNLETAIVRLQELTDASKNFKRATFGALIFTILQFALGLNLLNKIAKGATGIGLVVGIGKLFGAIGGLSGILFKMRGAVVFLFAALKSFLKPLLVLLVIFDILSRALAFARLEDARRIPIALARISESFKRLTRAFVIMLAPIEKIVNAVAKFIAPLFQTSILVEALASALETLETVIVSALGGIVGSMTALIAVADNLTKGNFSKAFSGEEFAKVFEFASGEFFKKILGEDKFDDDLPRGGNVVNINTVNQRFDFKERIEPDRVAFTVAESLKKFGTNRTQGRGRQVNRAVGR